jgi:hypothetical protein
MAAIAIVLITLSPRLVGQTVLVCFRAGLAGLRKDLRMIRLVGFAGMLLATSAAAGEPGPVAMQSGPITPPEDVMAGHTGAAGLVCETRARHRPAPELEVTITPPKVTIPDNSEASSSCPSGEESDAT